VPKNKNICLYEEKYNLKKVLLYYHQTTVIFSDWQTYIDKGTSAYSFMKTTDIYHLAASFVLSSRKVTVVAGTPFPPPPPQKKGSVRFSQVLHDIKDRVKAS
jgi:hypothetical protein